MSPTQLPDYGEVLAEVREVRRAGIVRLRELRLPVLTGMSAGPGEAGSGEPHFPAVERLLRTAVAAMGGGTLQEAAEYSLGLARGTRAAALVAPSVRTRARTRPGAAASSTARAPATSFRHPRRAARLAAGYSLMPTSRAYTVSMASV
ncbi:hypothetical protein ACIQU4_18625 [Streptomyces sp. NPDC090741]|uniref:hypothetical protein n=1 Tax=Streptomyces sp. NPDC090741 TaxID=3365967 RepID=UPI0037FB0529